MAEQAVATSAFYLGSFSVLVMMLAIAVSLRQWVWLLYTLLALMGLAYIGLFEQNITGIVWTGVDLSPNALIVVGYAMLSINYLVAAFTLPEGHKWAWLKTPYRVAALGIWGLWAIGRTGPFEFGFLLFSIAGCTVAVAHFIPVSTFSKLRGGYDTIIRNLIWLLLVVVLVGATVVISGVTEGQAHTVTINRLIIAIITIGFGALFIRNIFVLQSDRELAMHEALERAEEKARISEELLAAREDHQTALGIARDRTMRLATASHDIRQPLTSLRTSFAVLSREMPQDMQTHLQSSLDYLDELASSYLEDARGRNDAMPLDGTALAEQERLSDETEQTVRAEQIGDTLERMFEQDAAERDLILTKDVASAELHTQPLALMRVLCNVMSNAIAHGAPGQLSLQGTASEAGYTFTIRNPGSSELEFDAWEKGSSSEGHGLGLTIIRDQAAKAGLILSKDASEGESTTFTITVPATEAGKST